MAPSVTTVTSASSKRNGKAANGKFNGAAIPATGVSLTAERDEAEAIDKNYRDFFWTYTEEPHRTRRLAIIKAHPEVCFVSSFTCSFPQK